jgi:hypothetical protein
MTTWVYASGGTVPEEAFKAGRDENGIIYICRARHEGDLIPGKVSPAVGIASVSYNGKEHTVEEYEVLCGFAFYWMPTTGDDTLPGRALSSGQTASGEVLYVGRVLHNGYDVVGKV